MRFKKFTALILSLCLVFTSGCGLVDSLAEEIENVMADFLEAGGEVLISPVSGEGFEHIERTEIAFEEMEYFHYSDEEFLALCDRVYAIAEEGGSEDELSEIINQLYTELCLLFTMIELASIEYYCNPMDTAWEEEMNYSSELYFLLSDEYMYALGAVANSPNSKLLEYDFHPDDIDYLAEVYGEKISQSDSELQMDMYSAENDLLSRYYTLMSEEMPDERAVAELFVELVKGRQEEAEWYGYDSYAQYAYESFYYRDYSPTDAEVLHQGVKENFAAVSEDFYWERVDIEDRLAAGNRIDCSTEAVLGALERNLPKLSSELGEAFDYMKRNGLYNIDYSQQKANMGYTTRLYYYDVPFIFNAPYGYFVDYMDMIHEFGHFANAFYTTSDIIWGMSDNDLAELQSQGLEVLFTAFYGDIFGTYADEAEDYLLMDLISSVVDGAMYDEFQQRVYAEKNLTADRVCEIFTEIYVDYGYEPYEGYEYEWIYLSHNFEFPFYYISYAASALPALELYSLMQTDPEAAAEKYLQVCAMDTEYYYFSEAIDEAGFSDIFDSGLYPQLAGDILGRPG